MTLATASAEGRPEARTVLLKGFDADGVVSCTHACFASRSRESRHGASASPQSRVVADRALLEARLAEFEARLRDRSACRREGGRWRFERLAS